MKFTIVQQLLFLAFSMVLTSNNEVDGLEIEDATVTEHDVSKWGSEDNKNIELSEAIVDGLAATTMKRHMPVKPITGVVRFNFYNYVTEFVKKYVNGITTVRLASIIIHYKPHTDDCRGTLSYALVDNRFDKDSMTAKKGGRSDADYKIVGKVKHLVTLRCSEEAIIQMSLNHFVSASNLKKINLVQIASGLDMKSGDLATISIGWKTIPGDATVYKHYPAQKYVIPRLSMPELVGKSSDYVYNKIVNMAKVRQNREVQMLNKLQELIDGQNTINNQLETDYENELSKLDLEIKRHQDDIERIEKVIPTKSMVEERLKQLDELKRLKGDKIKMLHSKSISEKIVDLNDDDIVSVIS
nr:movement protein [Alfalfa ringspot-associated virus]WCR76262.1 movement protein [Alfalfa ringspot-associated virus]WCR76263.1 movement protein [Alfalfa ringspot-associated virus]